MESTGSGMKNYVPTVEIKPNLMEGVGRGLAHKILPNPERGKGAVRLFIRLTGQNT